MHQGIPFERAPHMDIGPGREERLDDVRAPDATRMVHRGSLTERAPCVGVRPLVFFGFQSRVPEFPKSPYTVKPPKFRTLLPPLM